MLYTMNAGNMNTIQQKSATKKPNPYLVGDNVLETVRSLGGTVKKTMQQDVIQKIPEAIVHEMFASGQQSQELLPDKPTEIQSEYPSRPQSRERTQPLVSLDQQHTEQALSLIREQLKTLAKQTNNPELQKAAIAQPAEEQGIYHQTFFERLTSMAKKLATNPDDGLTWFREAGTKRKRLSFWSGYKKHGTSFGLSYERTLATQAG